MSLDEFMGEEPANGVNIIDASQLIIATISANYAKKGEADFLTEGYLRHLILDTLRNNVTRNKAKYPEAIIAFDDSRDGYWRRDVAWYYKKNRAKGREDSAINWEKVFPWINKIIDELCVCYPRMTIRVSKTEADDIIGVLVPYFANQGREVLITSGDGDFTQLHEHKGVKQWSPTLKKFVKPKHGSPYADLMVKIVKGDKKDGVAPIKCRSDYIITKVDGERAPSVTQKWLDELTAAVDPKELLTDDLRVRFEENQLLIDFKFIPDYIRDPIIEMYKTKKIPAQGRLYSYFVKNSLSKLLPQISTF